MLDNEFELIEKERDNAFNQIASIEHDNDRLTMENARLLAERNEYQLKYDSMVASRFWRLTKPLRTIRDVVKNTRHGIANISTNKKAHVRIGVHLHLYYEDLVDEFCKYLDNIPELFDIYISCKEGAHKGRIRSRVKKINHVRKIVIKETINRGRDIAPFYVMFRDDLLKYDYLLHIHSKKSLYSGAEKSEWRKNGIEGVLKSEAIVARMLAIFDDNDDIGMIHGDKTEQLSIIALHWLKNIPRGRELLQRLGIEFQDRMFQYPIGSFFWVKKDAVKPIFDLNLTYNDFDEESGQIDGTLAHALDRVVTWVVRDQGYDSFIFDANIDDFHRNTSYYGIHSYLDLNVDSVTEELLKHDVITFDIFDTLITRVILHPDDVFLLMQKLIYEKYGVDVDFLSVRKQAESYAMEKRGISCNIYDIYNEMHRCVTLSQDVIDEIRDIEIELEYELCIPRDDVVEIYNRVKKANKKILLISDMYLTSDIVSRMLAKCGIDGYDDIWLSCEKGLRKDNESMWKKFFEEYKGVSTIHVGDNPCSDSQIVGDMGADSVFLLSSYNQLSLSTQYDKFKKYENTTVENSLMLGLLVNKYWYNSPFALSYKGVARLDDLEIIGASLFGPILLKFAELIQSMDTDKLLFLSREGFFFKRLYQTYCKCFNLEEKENLYFYTSRRAASVPLLSNDDDIREILKTEYEGSLQILLSERLGLEGLFDEDITISLPDDIDKVMSVLSDCKEKLFHEANEEREVYESYVRKCLDENSDSKVTLVDLGYAGTIQYYLSKLGFGNIDGCYLAMQNSGKIRVEKYKNIYNFDDDNIIKLHQLFLEALTAAPHGQVIKMNKQDDEYVPVLKDYSKKCYLYAEPMQLGVLKYVETIEKTLNKFKFTIDSELVKDIFTEVSRPNLISNAIGDIFIVDDGYSNSGFWVYDFDQCGWFLKDLDYVR